jgi:nitrogen regulatory protein P-II 1
VKLEMVVLDALLKPILEVLAASAKTGKIGDGKIFVSTIDDAIRIRNGDHGEAAL